MKNLYKFDWSQDDLDQVSLAFTILYAKDLGENITQPSYYSISSTGAKILPSFGDTKRISRIKLESDKS